MGKHSTLDPQMLLSVKRNKLLTDNWQNLKISVLSQNKAMHNKTEQNKKTKKKISQLPISLSRTIPFIGHLWRDAEMEMLPVATDAAGRRHGHAEKGRTQSRPCGHEAAFYLHCDGGHKKLLCDAIGQNCTRGHRDAQGSWAITDVWITSRAVLWWWVQTQGPCPC